MIFRQPNANKQKSIPKHRIYIGQQFDEKIVEANVYCMGQVDEKQTKISWTRPT